MGTVLTEMLEYGWVMTICTEYQNANNAAIPNSSDVTEVKTYAKSPFRDHCRITVIVFRSRNEEAFVVAIFHGESLQSFISTYLN